MNNHPLSQQTFSQVYLKYLQMPEFSENVVAFVTVCVFMALCSVELNKKKNSSTSSKSCFHCSSSLHRVQSAS